MPERFNPYKNAAADNGKGVLLVTPSPQPDIRKFTEGNRGWDYQAEAAKLYRGT